MSKYGRRWEAARQVERREPAKTYWVVFNSRGGPMFVVKTEQEAKHEVESFVDWTYAGPYVLASQHKREDP